MKNGNTVSSLSPAYRRNASDRPHFLDVDAPKTHTRKPNIARRYYSFAFFVSRGDDDGRRGSDHLRGSEDYAIIAVAQSPSHRARHPVLLLPARDALGILETGVLLLDRRGDVVALPERKNAGVQTRREKESEREREGEIDE